MGLFQPLPYGATKEEWDAWMLAVTNWANNVDGISAGLPVTKQGIDNIMQTSGSTSNAFLMYYVTSLPAKPSYSNQVVYNGQDGRIYAWNTTTGAWESTGATAFDQLTGFLQAGQLLLGDQLNICTNGCFTNDTVGQAPNGWSPTSTYSNNPVIVQPGGSTPAGCPTANCVQLSGRDTYFTSGGGFDVKPGDNYYLEGYMGSDGTTPGMQLGLYFPAVGSNGPLWSAATQAPVGLNGWMTSNGVITVPTWANRARVWLQVNSTGPTWGNNYFTGIECVKAPATAQQYSYSNNVAPGTLDLITGSFYTGYATFVMASVYAAGGGDNLNVVANLIVDGTTVDTQTMNLTTVATLSCTLHGIIPTNGSHTFSIQVQNNEAITITSGTNVSILNLLK